MAQSRGGAVLLLCPLILAWAIAPHAGAQQEGGSAPASLQKDFAELTGMFAGRWDNDRHVFFAEDAGEEAATVAPRQHLRVTPVDASDAQAAAGAKVFRAERTVEGGGQGGLQHTFTLNADARLIEQRMAQIDEDGATQPIADCTVFWRREGAQFVGETSDAGCGALFPRPESEGAFSVRMSLSATEYWVISRRGEAVVNARFRRARAFACWAAILRDASHGDSGEGLGDWDFRRGVMLHDQGGVGELTTDEDPPRRIRLTLRDVDWTYGDRRPSLTLYVAEGASDRALSYAWTEGGAERIGINLRWLQASCPYAPE